jgi:hypothetical protein
MNTSPECFIVYGTEVDPPALRMSLGPSNSSINLIHAQLSDRHSPGTSSSTEMDP